MLDKGIKEKVQIPEKVSVRVEGRMVHVEGPNGEISKKFDIRGIEVNEGEDEIVIISDSSRKERKASVGTVVSHIKNMFEGVTEGFTSKLKVVYSHFPISVSVRNGKVEIENFIGEEKARRAEIVGETEVEIKGEDIEVKGPDKDDVGQTAANIEQTASVKDRDPRVFQDGIYIVEAP